MVHTFFVHWAMWFEVEMSWNGSTKAAALGSLPRATWSGLTAVIPSSNPLGASGEGGGGRRPYMRDDEKVIHSARLVSPARAEMKGDHLGNELASAVLP